MDTKNEVIVKPHARLKITQEELDFPAEPVKHRFNFVNWDVFSDIKWEDFVQEGSKKGGHSE